jgi:hypothetical protein
MKAAVELNLGDGTDTDADSTEGQSQEVAGQPRGGIVDTVAIVETSLDEDAPCADRFRVFSDERPLLRKGDAWQA